MGGGCHGVVTGQTPLQQSRQGPQRIFAGSAEWVRRRLLFDPLTPGVQPPVHTVRKEVREEQGAMK